MLWGLSLFSLIARTAPAYKGVSHQPLRKCRGSNKIPLHRGLQNAPDFRSSHRPGPWTAAYTLLPKGDGEPLVRPALQSPPALPLAGEPTQAGPRHTASTLPRPFRQPRRPHLSEGTPALTAMALPRNDPSDLSSAAQSWATAAQMREPPAASASARGGSLH